MTQKLKVIVIGAGNVGLEVARQSRGVGYDVVAQVSSRAFIPLAGAAVTFDRRGDAAEIMMTVGPFCLKHGVKLALLTIPSSGDGSTETRYILSLTGVGIAVVTSGKSAFASFYDVLRPHLDTIGRTATVGGGTRILPELKERLDPTVPFVVDLVVNGTLSKVMSDIWKGSSVEAAIWEAIHLKYAEPPADGEEMSPLDVFQGELSDIRKKLAIILNDVPSLHAMSGQTVRPEDIEMQPLSDEYQRRFLPHSGGYGDGSLGS
ncbi:MAG: hypothetical protein UY63_C0017G0044 [Parcubacteria group bacterium GW2011_GWA2_51_10]|nr:MAG: hypothetical protein UY63_C0017G0044 [Parcubacteria group bacterium GW2011_GWA2_51_10]